MKKGQRLYLVEITKGFVTALDVDGNEIKLTRRQRSTLSGFKSKTYIQEIEKEWFKGAVHKSFKVVEDGEIVYTYTE